MTPHSFPKRDLSDVWRQGIFKGLRMNMDTEYHIFLIFPYLFRHGLARQGQKIRTVKPGLGTGKAALYPELGLLALCQPHKQARAKGKQVLINVTQHDFTFSEGSINV